VRRPSGLVASIESSVVTRHFVFSETTPSLRTYFFFDVQFFAVILHGTNGGCIVPAPIQRLSGAESLSIDAAAGPMVSLRPWW